MSQFKAAFHDEIIDQQLENDENLNTIGFFVDANVTAALENTRRLASNPFRRVCAPYTLRQQTALLRQSFDMLFPGVNGKKRQVWEIIRQIEKVGEGL